MAVSVERSLVLQRDEQSNGAEKGCPCGTPVVAALGGLH